MPSSNTRHIFRKGSAPKLKRGEAHCRSWSGSRIAATPMTTSREVRPNWRGLSGCPRSVNDVWLTRSDRDQGVVVAGAFTSGSDPAWHVLAVPAVSMFEITEPHTTPRAAGTGVARESWRAYQQTERTDIRAPRKIAASPDLCESDG